MIGTANEITVTNPTTTPTISIANTYVGQASITTLGTIGAGIWNGTPVTVPYGGTGIDTTTAYGVLCGGTTATNPLQNAGAGTANQAFISNGAAALPTWQSINASKAQQITGTSSTAYVTPSVQQFHPSAAKFRCTFPGTFVGTIAPTEGYNVTSVTFNSTGNYTINFTNPFINTTYTANITCSVNTLSQAILPSFTSKTTSSISFITILPSVGSSNPLFICASGYGTQ